MDETTRVQGREITKDEIELVRRLIESNPSWNRTRLSKDLCLLWNWRASNGQLKDMVCRTLLSKLEQWSHIVQNPPAGKNFRFFGGLAMQQPVKAILRGCQGSCFSVSQAIKAAGDVVNPQKGHASLFGDCQASTSWTSIYSHQASGRPSS